MFGVNYNLQPVTFEPCHAKTSRSGTNWAAVTEDGWSSEILDLRSRRIGLSYNLCSKNKGADQLLYRTADLCLCFVISVFVLAYVKNRIFYLS